jgi:hypothetical protein
MRELLSATAVALLVVASAGSVTSAKSKGPAEQGSLAEAVPLLVALSVTGWASSCSPGSTTSPYASPAARPSPCRSRP